MSSMYRPVSHGALTEECSIIESVTNGFETMFVHKVIALPW